MEFPAPASEKTVALVEFLCGCREPAGITEIAAAIGSNKNMVFRILKTLMGKGWVVQDAETQRYRMGLAIYHHASKIVERMDLPRAAAEPMRALNRETGMFTYLAILDGDRALFVETLEPTEGDVRISAKSGTRHPLHCTAPGKALLAHHPEVVPRVTKRSLPRFTGTTLTTSRALKEELATIKETGLAFDREEGGRGIICVASPIFDHRDEAVGAIGISSLTLLHTMEELAAKAARRVERAARAISSALGHQPRRRSSL